MNDRVDDTGKPTDEMRSRWRLIVLLAVATLRGGAAPAGLATGLRIIPQAAIADALHKLEGDGLIVHRDGRWFPVSGLELNFNI